MPNGTGLTKGPVVRSYQTSIILPKPGSDHLYYIFTSNSYGTSVEQGLFYAVVDMSLENGLGDVTEKNVMLYPYVIKGLAAVRHANGRDFWVVSHDWGTQNYSDWQHYFLSFLVTDQGISPDPVKSRSTRNNILMEHSNQMKISPDGNWIATCNYTAIGLSNFSTYSGKVRNTMILGDPSFNSSNSSPETYNAIKGLEFSANSSFFLRHWRPQPNLTVQYQQRKLCADHEFCTNYQRL